VIARRIWDATVRLLCLAAALGFTALAVYGLYLMVGLLILIAICGDVATRPESCASVEWP
jgi:hypothetical protein